MARQECYPVQLHRIAGAEVRGRRVAPIPYPFNTHSQRLLSSHTGCRRLRKIKGFGHREAIRAHPDAKENLACICFPSRWPRVRIALWYNADTNQLRSKREGSSAHHELYGTADG